MTAFLVSAAQGRGEQADQPMWLRVGGEVGELARCGRRGAVRDEPRRFDGEGGMQVPRGARERPERGPDNVLLRPVEQQAVVDDTGPGLDVRRSVARECAP